MEKITYLRPTGATFSELAYVKLAKLVGAPSIISGGEEFLVNSNEEVLPLVVKNRGWGVIAMETMAEGRVEGPVTTFLELLKHYNNDCLTTVLGAIEMPINFALMVRKGVALYDIKTVVAHIKSFGACKKKIKALNVPFIESTSNGQAAEDVATKSEFAQSAALGPRIASDKYGLSVLEEAFEDELAITTFFLLGPRKHVFKTSVSESLRAMLVLRFKNEPGSMVKVFLPFAQAGINVCHVRDHYVGNKQYDFVAQLDFRLDQGDDFLRSMNEASRHTMRHILFGPFPVVTG